MGTRGTRGTNYFSQEINKLEREGDAPERALIELAKNNLSHPSHPSHLAPLDVIWSILGVSATRNHPRALFTQGGEHAARGGAVHGVIKARPLARNQP